MKIYMSILAMMLGVMLHAQQANPVVQKEGETVKATYFHENGAVAQVGYFLHGELHGEWKMYDAQGNKVAMGQYENGKKTGKWFFWGTDGLKEVDYEYNQIAGVTQWNNGEAVVVNNR